MMFKNCSFVFASDIVKEFLGYRSVSSAKTFSLFFTLFVFSNASADYLSLDEAIHEAVNNDEWLQGNLKQESALRDEAISNGSLPDPTLSLNVLNLPTDSWSFDQENMTQIKVGVSQRIPGGRSLKMKARKQQLMADVNPYLRLNRRAQLALEVTRQWYDGYLALKSIQLIEEDRYLFEQMVEVTSARYQSAVGQIRQQDVDRARLELTRLDDRLIRLRMHYETNKQLLSEWLPENVSGKELPKMLLEAPLFTPSSLGMLEASIGKHPLLIISDKQVDIQQAEIDLSKELYKPGWGLNASYGYREDTPEGSDRADFISFGVSVGLPLLTNNRQDKVLSSSQLRKESLVIDYNLLRKKLFTQALKIQAELIYLQERSDIYQKTLLTQAREQTDSALSAYTNSDGDFTDVVTALITELNSKIEALEIDIKKRKALAAMNYLLIGENQQQENNYEY